MSCYHPLVGIDTGFKTENGRPAYHIMTRLQFEHEYPQLLSRKNEKWIEIPCGKCVGCRMSYAKTWADRCILEAQYHEQNWFCTFTYNQACVPMVWSSVDPHTGEVLDDVPGVMTCRYKDFQDFLKRLRKEKGKFRYFACSEYGGQTLRPHYHAILFGLKLSEIELVPYKTIGKYVYYSCPTLERIWKNGFVVVTPLTYSTAAYTARYCLKKADTKVVDYEEIGIEPERTYMSRRPGLAYQYYLDHDMYEYDYLTVGTDDGSKRIYPSRYFDKLLEKDDPERFAALKEKRLKNMEANIKMKLDQSDYDYLDMLQVEEEALLDRLSGLSRDRLDDKEVKK